MKKYLLAFAAAGVLAAACTPDNESAAPTVNVDQATADQALSVMALDGSGFVTFGGMNFANGEIVLTDVVITPPEREDGEEEEGDLQFNADADQVLAERLIIGAPRVDGNGDVLLSRFVLEGVTGAEMPEGDAMLIERIVIDRPNRAFSNDIARIFRGEFTGDDVDLNWGDYTFGAVAIEGLSASSTGESDNGEAFMMELARLGFDDLDGDRLGRFEMTGFTFEGESDEGPVNISLQEISLDGLNTAGFAAMAEAENDEMEDEMMSQWMGQMMTNPAEVYDSFAMRGFDLSAAGVFMNLDEFIGSIERRGDSFETRSSLNSLTVSADASSPAGAQFAGGIGMVGYEEIELSMRGQSVYDPDADRVYTTGENYIEMTDGLRIDFESDMSGYNAYTQALAEAYGSGAASPDDPEAQMELMQSAMSQLTVNSLSIRIQDLSLLDRAVNAAAAMQGAEPEQVRAQAGMMVAMGMMSAPPELAGPFMTSLSESLTTFINEGGAITLRMDPPEPYSMGQLMQDAEQGSVDFEAMGLSVDNE